MNKLRDVMICGAAVLLAMSAGCGRQAGHNDQAACLEKCKEEPVGEDKGHGHGEEAMPAFSEKRAMEKCEHNIPMYQCNECRYEAGVVRLDATIMKSAGGGLVQTQAVTRAKISQALSVTGEVALDENAAVHISPRIAGTIESVAVDIGARVRAGDLLFTMISVELGRALVAYERNRTLADLAEKTFLREKRLNEQKVGSEQDAINAQMAYEQHRTEFKASEQTLHVLGLTESDLSGIKEPLHGTEAGRLPVRAPIAGTIIEKHAVAGEMAEPGKDVMLLADLSAVWVWVDLHSRDLPQLLEAERQGAVEVDVSVSAFGEKRFRGVITYIGATMNEKTRTVKVRATVKNKDFLLRPGMFCEAVILIADSKAGAVTVVPQRALFSHEGRSFVFRHWKDDYYVRQDLDRGREWAGQVEVGGGLQEGDVIVADGAFLLKSDILREKMGAGCAD